MKYRIEIDGLRAIAVISVILYHAGFKAFSGGYVGVDVFFVISGYLITSIIICELNSGKFSLINFYERRARRILPALFLVMFVCLPFAWFWLLPDALEHFSNSLIAVSTFISNVYFWKNTDYFDNIAELKPLIHTWSLSVEEQFYIFLPFLLLTLWKIGKHWIPVSLIVLFAISFTWSLCLTLVSFSSFAFYMLPTRGWELMIGAFIAYFHKHLLHLNKFNKCINQYGSIIGLTLISYSIFSYTEKTPFPGLYALAPTIGTALILIF